MKQIKIQKVNRNQSRSTVSDYFIKYLLVGLGLLTAVFRCFGSMIASRLRRPTGPLQCGRGDLVAAAMQGFRFVFLAALSRPIVPAPIGMTGLRESTRYLQQRAREEVGDGSEREVLGTCYYTGRKNCSCCLTRVKRKSSLN